MEENKKQEIGTVEKRDGNNRYWVKIERNAACGSCKACNFGKQNHIVLPAVSDTEFTVGDKVRIEMSVKKTYLSSLILYVLPIFLLLAAFFITYAISGNEMLGLCVSLGGLIVGFLVIFLLDKLLRKYTVAKIISKEDMD